jgi:Tfp pilus assembly protein PilO
VEVPAITVTSKVPAAYQKYLRYGFPALAVVVAIMAVVLYILPGINDDLALKEEVDANAAKAQALDAKIATLQGVSIDNLTADLAKAEVALPTEKDIAGFLANINQITANSNTSIQGAQLIAQAAVSKTTTSNAIQFQLIIKGNYPALRTFLTKVETARRVMTLLSININAADNGQLAADLSVDTYYEPAPAVTPGNPDPLPVRTAAQTGILAQLDNRTNLVPPIPTPSSSGRVDPFSGF